MAQCKYWCGEYFNNKFFSMNMKNNGIYKNRYLKKMVPKSVRQKSRVNDLCNMYFESLPDYALN